MAVVSIAWVPLAKNLNECASARGWKRELRCGNFLPDDLFLGKSVL